MPNYRERIYNRYASIFKDQQTGFDEQKTDQWSQGYHYYFRGWLPENKKAAITDLACGTGNILYFFDKKGYTNLSGVDLSPEQVAIAQERFPFVEQGNLLSFLEEKKEQFDLITGLDIIEHLTKDEVLDFLDACYQALKPNGRLILQTPNAASLWSNTVRYGDFTHEVCFEEGVLKHLLHLCHFRDVETREMGPIPRGYSLKSSIRYLLWQGIRKGIQAINMIETGSVGNHALTRVFLLSAIK